MRAVKVFGGLIVVGLLLASLAASAGATTFQAAGYTAEVEGQQTKSHLLTAEGLTVTCEKATLTGELYEPAEEITKAAPAFTECTASGIAATVATEGCTLTLDATHSNMDIACPSEKKIKVTAVGGSCELQIGTQSGVSKITYANAGGSPAAVSMTEEAEGIKYTKTKDGFLCPLSGTGEKSDGKLSGAILLKAYTEGQVEMSLGALAPTVLCAIENSEPCTNAHAEGSTVEAKLTGKTALEFILANKATTLACTESTIKGTTAAAPDGGAGIHLNLSVLSFGTCGCSVSMTSPHAFFLAAGGGNGLFELVRKDKVNPRMTIVCGGETCVFEVVGVQGVVTGGKPAKLVFTNQGMLLNTKLSHANCLGPLKISATYEYKEPAKGHLWVTI